MGHLVNPVSFRLGNTSFWRANYISSLKFSRLNTSFFLDKNIYIFINWFFNINTNHYLIKTGFFNGIFLYRKRKQIFLNRLKKSISRKRIFFKLLSNYIKLIASVSLYKLRYIFKRKILCYFSFYFKFLIFNIYLKKKKGWVSARIRRKKKLKKGVRNLKIKKSKKKKRNKIKSKKGHKVKNFRFNKKFRFKNFRFNKKFRFKNFRFNKKFRFKKKNKKFLIKRSKLRIDFRNLVPELSHYILYRSGELNYKIFFYLTRRLLKKSLRFKKAFNKKRQYSFGKKLRRFRFRKSSSSIKRKSKFHLRYSYKNKKRRGGLINILQGKKRLKKLKLRIKKRKNKRNWLFLIRNLVRKLKKKKLKGLIFLYKYRKLKVLLFYYLHILSILCKKRYLASAFIFKKLWVEKRISFKSLNKFNKKNFRFYFRIKKFFYYLFTRLLMYNNKKTIVNLKFLSNRFREIYFNNYWFFYFNRLINKFFSPYTFTSKIIFIRPINMSARLLFNFFCFHLRRRKSVGKILSLIMIDLKKQKSLLGFKIITSGRFTRRERALYKWYNSGRIPLSVYNTYLDFYVGTFKSRFGVCSLKIWIFKN
jgi:hypothetical protein